MFQRLAFLRNRRFITVLFLGFSSALPLTLTSSTLQAWFTQAGVSLMAIGALSFIGLPYSLKFLWSPIMDRFVPPFLGRRRGWIALTQIGLCAALLLLSILDPGSQAPLMGKVALVIVFLSASQDIAFDAYRTDILLPEERGTGSAILLFGLRLGLLFSGGLALIFADHWGWRATYEVMAVAMAALVFATWFAPECAKIDPPKSFMAAIVDPFKDLMRRDSIVLILLFIVLYKIGDALATALMSSFLLRGLGFSLTDVGVAYKSIGLLATLVGAFAGGIYLMRLGVYRALMVFALAQAFSNLTFMCLAIIGKSYFFMLLSVCVENFCSGMSTAAFLAFLMSLCNQRFSATQYALFSALFSIGRIIVGPLAAMLVLHVGWVGLYAWSFMLCFPGLIILMMLRERVVFDEKAFA